MKRKIIAAGLTILTLTACTPAYDGEATVAAKSHKTGWVQNILIGKSITPIYHPASWHVQLCTKECWTVEVEQQTYEALTVGQSVNVKDGKP